MNPTLKPWIRWLFNEEATGLLKKEYDSAIKRAGRIWNIGNFSKNRDADCNLHTFPRNIEKIRILYG